MLPCAPCSTARSHTPHPRARSAHLSDLRQRRPSPCPSRRRPYRPWRTALRGRRPPGCSACALSLRRTWRSSGGVRRSRTHRAPRRSAVLLGRSRDHAGSRCCSSRAPTPPGRR
eukprot:scaffold27422_cov70-Phaeocystis_antarctica.AAC.8